MRNRNTLPALAFSTAIIVLGGTACNAADSDRSSRGTNEQSAQDDTAVLAMVQREVDAVCNHEPSPFSPKEWKTIATRANNMDDLSNTELADPALPHHFAYDTLLHGSVITDLEVVAVQVICEDQ